jgi:hypothetical protein
LTPVDKEPRPLENYFMLSHLGAQIDAFVDDYNCRRYHDNQRNLTSDDIYLGREQAILERRDIIKRKTIEKRRLEHQQVAA